MEGCVEWGDAVDFNSRGYITRAGSCVRCYHNTKITNYCEERGEGEQGKKKK